jgi:hypothetical protein
MLVVRRILDMQHRNDAFHGKSLFVGLVVRLRETLNCPVEFPCRADDSGSPAARLARDLTDVNCAVK